MSSTQSCTRLYTLASGGICAKDTAHICHPQSNGISVPIHVYPRWPFGFSEIWAWIRNHIEFLLWCVITHPCFNFKDDFSKPSLKLRHGCAITSPLFYADVVIYACPELSVGWAYISKLHYGDVIMGAIASQITSLTIIYSTFYSDAVQRKHQRFASLAFVCGELTGDRLIPLTNGQ